jgi:hypothetical protein
MTVSLKSRVLIIAVLPTSIFFKVPGALTFFTISTCVVIIFLIKNQPQKEPVARVLISF